MDYLELLGRLHEGLRPEIYLEIGVDKGDSLRLSQTRSIAIDPNPQPRPEAFENKPWVKLFLLPSDEFFHTRSAESTLRGRSLDLAFIDGLHEFAQVVRDLENVERWGHSGTVVVIHDVIPPYLWEASRKFRPDGWTGDVWRIVDFLRRYRPDLHVRLVDAARSAALIVTGLDPTYSEMSRLAEEIDQDFPGDGPEYERLVLGYLASVAPEPTETVLDELLSGRWPGFNQHKRRDAKQPVRDAVVFAWYVPPQMPDLGTYFLELLAHYHHDSKIFVGMNHGSDPIWEERLRSAQLDVDIRWALSDSEDYWDTTGFITALQGFHQTQESFDLVWFGHTKGGSRAQFEDYTVERRALERNFWAKRDTIESLFGDPKIGIFAPRFSPLPEGFYGAQLPALQRIYRDNYAPLGLHAKETFFTLRGEIVRRFLTALGEPFFHTPPGDYGANKYFFEIGFPNIASMQGYEPYIDPHVAGDGDPREDGWLRHDPRQNHRLAMRELERWREDPVNFRPRAMRELYDLVPM